MNTIEWLGIVGTILIMLSYITSKVFWLRLINIFGSAFFVVYGIYTQTWSTAVLNFLCIVVNIWKIIEEHKHSDNTNCSTKDLLEIADTTDVYESLKELYGFDDDDIFNLNCHVDVKRNNSIKNYVDKN